jgi:hypothetical protein
VLRGILRLSFPKKYEAYELLGWWKMVKFQIIAVHVTLQQSCKSSLSHFPLRMEKSWQLTSNIGKFNLIQKDAIIESVWSICHYHLIMHLENILRVNSQPKWAMNCMLHPFFRYKLKKLENILSLNSQLKWSLNCL